VPHRNGPGAYRRLLWLGDLCHDRQALDAGVVASVVGDEREVVFEGGRGDPGVGGFDSLLASESFQVQAGIEGMGRAS
jgi:hypothetical protein